MMKNKKILVTGGSGYFGSLLVYKLNKIGCEIVNFDLNPPDENLRGVTFIQGDIRNLDSIKAATKGIDIVFHNVAQVPIAKDINLFWSVNERGTENLIEACLVGGVKKIVYTSSSAVFGVPEKNPVTELTQPAPVEDYGRAKLAGEIACLNAAKKGDLEIVIIRPRTILGHGRLGIFQILFEWIHEGSNVPVLGKGDNVYQFVHAEDLADACVLAAEKSSGTKIYNCGAKTFGTMRETLQGLVDYAKTGSQVSNIPEGLAVMGMKATSFLGLSPLGPYHWMMYGKSLYFDISKAENELGWNPKFSNVEMMIDSYNWYVKNRSAVLTAKGKSHHKSAIKHGVLSLAKYFF
jgi:nucleoside-diphosphate-sugar epimerase